MRASRGQASLEYLALWALLSIVLAGAAALTADGLGRQVLYGIERGLCALVGRPCAAPPPAVADLAPCPLHRSSRTQDFHVGLTVVRLGAGLAVLQERFSDGAVAVTFADTGHGALTAGVGAHFEMGPLKGGALASAAVGVGFTTGRTWRFPSQGAADAFVRRYGSDQTLLGRVGNDARRICPVCHLVGWEPARPPAPDAVYAQGGGLVEAGASAGLGLHGEARAALAGALGRRRARDGTKTWYVRLDGEVAARISAGLGVGAGGRASAVAEYTVDGTGRVKGLAVRVAGLALVESAGVPALSSFASALPRFSGHGGAVEAEIALDLDEPGNAATAHALLGALAHARTAELARRVDDVLARVRDHGTATLRTFGLRDRHGALDAAVALGPVAEGGYAHADQQLELTGVYERLPGLGFLPRADCLTM